MRHLLSIEDLDRAGIERILDRARSFTEVSEREVKKVPALRGRRVLNLFYEASTRTRSSFELAAKTLSAEVINFASGGSSVEKGESLKDTVQTLSRLPARPDRRPHAARRRRARWSPTGAPPRSSTPATASTSTRRRRCSTSTRCASGSARSTAPRSGSSATSCTRASRARTSSRSPSSAREVTVCGPPTLIPRGMEALGCDVEYTLDRLPEADVVYALRMQHERMTDSFVPSLREYAARYQIDGRRLGAAPGAHAPGPGQPRRRAGGRGDRLAAGA